MSRHVHCKLQRLSFTVYISGQISLVLEQVTSILPAYIFFRDITHSYWARASSLPRLHDHTQFDTPHSVGLLSTSDRPVAGDLYLTTHNNHKRQISMPPAGSEPTKASERPQTHWLDPVYNGGLHYRDCTVWILSENAGVGKRGSESCADALWYQQCWTLRLLNPQPYRLYNILGVYSEKYGSTKQMPWSLLFLTYFFTGRKKNCNFQSIC